MNYNIGLRIRETREAQHYTRDALAEKVGISTKFLYEIESRNKGFSAETLIKIADALSVSCDFIMTGEEIPERSSKKIICTLERIEPRRISRIQEVLEMLNNICDGIRETPGTDTKESE